MNLARDAGAGEPDDEDSLAALLAVLTVLGADAGTSDARSDGRSGGEALARWRARRMAGLGRTLPEADGVRPPRRHA
jgi:hypothetical protein